MRVRGLLNMQTVGAWVLGRALQCLPRREALCLQSQAPQLYPSCGAPSGERVAARLHARTTTANNEQRAEQQREATRGRSRIDFRRRHAAAATTGPRGNSVEAAAGVACLHEVASTEADTAMVVDTTSQIAATGAIIGDRIANHRHGAGLCHCPTAENLCRAVKADA